MEWNAPEDWLVYEDAHDPLIDRVTFERAQRLMKERGEHAYATGFLTGKAKVSRYLLSGLLQCGACGGSMHGRTLWKSKRRKDGSRVGTSYYVCGASITKGRSVCQPIQFLQGPMDEFVMDIVGKKLASYLGKTGRATLRRLVVRELQSLGRDPRPELSRLKENLAEIARKTDSVIDLAASTPQDRDLLNERLGRLRLERREVEGRLRELEGIPVHAADPDAIVDALLDGLADARRLFEQGTMEERKRVVRAFVDGLKVVGSKRSGEIRMKKLPALELVSAGSSVESLAGVLYEVQKRNRTWMLQVVRVRFAVRGTALVPVRGRRIAPSSRDGTAQGPERMAALCGVGSPSGDDGPGPWPGCFRPN